MRGKNGCAFGYVGCYQQHTKAPKTSGFHFLSDAELREVVLPKLGRLYASDERTFTNEVRFAKRRDCGCPIIRSEGDGKMHGCDCIEGDPVERYLEVMGAPNCCTVAEPCDRHRGALRGRHWKTGEYL